MQALQFGALFEKLPGRITAVRQGKPFAVPMPEAWGGKPGDMVSGKAGDFKATNAIGETYPLAAQVLAEKYEHVAGDIYQTRQDQPVLKEGRLPNPGEIMIETAEGPVPTSSDGIPSVIMTDAGGEFPLSAKNFATFYKAVDEEAQQIMTQIQTWLAGKK